MRLAKPTFLAVLAVALAAYAFDCGATTTPEQAMQCCNSMPCSSHGHHGQDCCKTMVSSQSPSVLPAEHSVLNVPVAVVADHLSATKVIVIAEVAPSRFEAPQHSPPDLYTLHSSLLI
jgi:hypothetical protein